MANNVDIQFQMRISALNVVRFSQYDFDGAVDPEEIDFHSNFGVKINAELSEIAIEITVQLKIKDADIKLSELKVVMKFEIHPFHKVIVQENDEFRVPDQIMINLFNIAAGTIRGIIHERLKGTELQAVIFPLLDVNSLLKSK